LLLLTSTPKKKKWLFAKNLNVTVFRII
jgi:hypothetical protein